MWLSLWKLEGPARVRLGREVLESRAWRCYKGGPCKAQARLRREVGPAEFPVSTHPGRSCAHISTLPGQGEVPVRAETLLPH